MEHKVWKGAFVTAVIVDLIWFMETIGAAIMHWGATDFAESSATIVCLLLGIFTLPIMVGVTAYIAAKAFR